MKESILDYIGFTGELYCELSSRMTDREIADRELHISPSTLSKWKKEKELLITIPLFMNFLLMIGYRGWKKVYLRKKLQKNTGSKVSLPIFNIKKEEGYRLNMQGFTEKKK